MKSLVSNSILQIPYSSLAIQFPHKLVFKTKLSFRDRHSLLFRNHKSLKFTAFVASSSNSVTSSSNSAQVAEEDPESTQLFEVFTYLFLFLLCISIFMFYFIYNKVGFCLVTGKVHGKKNEVNFLFLF
jgi:ATP-dependent Zn protease